MGCDVIETPAGRAIVCSTTQRCSCGRRADRQCDWKVPARRSGTCDRYVCRWCAVSPAAGKDLCPQHAAAFETWKAARA